MGQRCTDDSAAKTRRERMGMSQGVGVNGDTGMDNMVHVNKGQSESTQDEGVVETQGEAQWWQARQGHMQHVARMGMDDGVTGCTVRGGRTVGRVYGARGACLETGAWGARLGRHSGMGGARSSMT